MVHKLEKEINDIHIIKVAPSILWECPCTCTYTCSRILCYMYNVHAMNTKGTHLQKLIQLFLVFYHSNGHFAVLSNILTCFSIVCCINSTCKATKNNQNIIYIYTYIVTQCLNLLTYMYMHI